MRAVKITGRRSPWIAGFLALIGLVAVFVALAGAALQAQTARDGASAWELHTVKVQLETERLLARMQYAETSERGFLLSRDPAFLGPYRNARREIPTQLDVLARLTADNPGQQRHVIALRQLVAERLNRLEIGLSQASNGGVGAAAAGSGEREGREAMDAVRREVAAMVSEEDHLLAIRADRSRAAADRMRQWLYGLFALGAVLLIGSLLAAVAALAAGRATREAANRAAVAERVNAELETRIEAAIRDLRETEGQLRQAQKMEAIGHLTGGVAHDFNNMLAVVIGALELANRRLARGDSDIGRYLESAAEGAKRGALLTQRLLAFARQQPLQPVVVDANALVAGMSELLRHTLGEKVKLETVLAGGLWRTRADPNQLESAILNLAVNARDAITEDGRLTVETANAHLDDAYAAENPDVDPGQYVVVAISDTGAGMTPQVAARAVDPFFTTKDVGKGSGLGLSQVFGFVKQSGGHLKIYSEVGHGTTVKIYLPRAFVDADAPSDVVRARSVLPSGDLGELILVVEDEDQVRKMSVEALRDLGYTVLHASNGPDALKLIERTPSISLLFTDVIMPNMNGRQLADAARVAAPDLKVLYTTGYTRNAIIHDGQLDPGVAFISKPFTLDQLADKVRRTLDQG